MKTTIKYEPLNELVIHQLLKISPKDFHNRVIIQGWGQVKYVNKILLVHTSPRDTAQMVLQEVSGKIHWTYVEFTKCEKLPDPAIIKVSGNGTEIPIIDMSMHPVFIDFANWLKSQPIWEDKS